jgi:DNA-binding Xre family transcriptional regulator
VNETKPSTVTFDGARFLEALDAIRESHEIDSVNKLTQIIGINHSSLAALSNGEGVRFETIIKIVAWSKLDLRKYITETPA